MRGSAQGGAGQHAEPIFKKQDVEGPRCLPWLCCGLPWGLGQLLTPILQPPCCCCRPRTCMALPTRPAAAPEQQRPHCTCWRVQRTSSTPQWHAHAMHHARPADARPKQPQDLQGEGLDAGWQPLLARGVATSACMQGGNICLHAGWQRLRHLGGLPAPPGHHSLDRGASQVSPPFCPSAPCPSYTLSIACTSVLALATPSRGTIILLRAAATPAPHHWLKQKQRTCTCVRQSMLAHCPAHHWAAPSHAAPAAAHPPCPCGTSLRVCKGQALKLAA